MLVCHRWICVESQHLGDATRALAWILLPTEELAVPSLWYQILSRKERKSPKTEGVKSGIKTVGLSMYSTKWSKAEYKQMVYLSCPGESSSQLRDPKSPPYPSLLLALLSHASAGLVNALEGPHDACPPVRRPPKRAQAWRVPPLACTVGCSAGLLLSLILCRTCLALVCGPCDR